MNKGSCTELQNQRLSSGISIREQYNVGKRIPQFLAFFFSLTYIILFIDVLVEHHIGLVTATPARLVPVAFAFLGAAISIVTGLWFNRVSLRLFVIAMGLSILVGLIGTYFHIIGSLDNITAGIFHVFPPKFAPLSFSGVGIMGLLIAIGYLKPSLNKNELVLDPICSRHFPKSMAQAAFKVNGHTYYLCCPVCVSLFRKSRGLIR